MNRKWNRLYAAEVSLTAATIQGSITVQHFFPETRLGNAKPVILPDHGREVAHEEQLVSGIPSAPEKVLV